MVVFNLGYTAPINTPGSLPILTGAQVWAALQLKVREPVEFVPVIQSYEIVTDTPTSISTENGTNSERDTDETTTITRYVTFQPGCGLGPPDGQPVKETCNEFPPCRVDFYQGDGSKIANYVTRGGGGRGGGDDAEDSFLTFVDEWRHPSVKAGSEEANILEGKHRTTATRALESTIQTMRRLAGEGRLG